MHLLTGDVGVVADGREVGVPEVLGDEPCVACGLAQPVAAVWRSVCAGVAYEIQEFTELTGTSA
jgi:hypothetical protein